MLTAPLTLRFGKPAYQGISEPAPLFLPLCSRAMPQQSGARRKALKWAPTTTAHSAPFSSVILGHLGRILNRGSPVTALSPSKPETRPKSYVLNPLPSTPLSCSMQNKAYRFHPIFKLKHCWICCFLSRISVCKALTQVRHKTKPIRTIW